MSTDLGLRVVGPPTARRRLVDMRAALRACAAADDAARCTDESYLTALAYGAELRDCAREPGRYRQYSGPIGPAAGFLPIDLDAADDPGSAIRAAGRMHELLTGPRYCIDPAHVLVMFSGSKGAHVLLPAAYWRPAPSELLHRQARRLIERLAREADATIDPAVYSSLALYRAPNSRHPATGCHKVRLQASELRLPLARIQAIAARPRPFDWPVPVGHSPRLAALWQQAAADVADRQAKQTAHALDDARLTAATRRFIRSGAGQGDRHRLLFSAAANLAECGAPPELARALLIDIATDVCGLSPADAERQIACGYRHGTTHQKPTEAGSRP